MTSYEFSIKRKFRLIFKKRTKKEIKKVKNFSTNQQIKKTTKEKFKRSTKNRKEKK